MSNLIRNPHVDSELEAAVQRDEHGTETISTAQVAPNLRNAVWEARNRSHLIGLKAGSPSSAGLMGTMRSAVINGMAIADINGNAHTVERTPGMARQLPLESVCFTFVLAGESFHFNGTSPVLVKQGEVAVYDSDTPFLLGFSEGMHAVVASVPRYHLAEIGMQDAFRTLKVMRHSGNGVESQSTRHFLDVLFGAFEPPAGVNPHEFGEIFVEDTLRAMRRLSGKSRDATQDYFAEARAFIQRHLSDPGLTVSDIAEALNLSQRHLSRIFSAYDTTVAHAIQELRLDHARTLLTSPEATRMTAAEVALRSGFVSPSHFSRVFRNHFDMSPTEARRAPFHPDGEVHVVEVRATCR
jgi:AraC-like DNA-binding protein